jgi:hypothetical protein
MAYNGIIITDQITTFDNLNTKTNDSLLVVSEVAVQESEELYNVSFKYELFNGYDISISPMNFQFVGLITNFEVGGKINVVEKCYQYISNYLTSINVVHSLNSMNVILDGLVLYLDSTNSNSYTGTGNNWYDLSARGNDCIFNNTPTFNNNCFTFNGTTNYGTITNNSTLDFSSNQTLFIWMKHTYTVGRKNPWDQAYGGYGTWTHEQGDSISQYFGDSGSNTSPYIGPTSITTPRDIWYCMSITRDTIEHKWFFNGVRTKTTAHSYGVLTATAANIRIGNGYAGYWEGDMAIVMAYNRCLSESDVLQNYDDTKGKFGY